MNGELCGRCGLVRTKMKSDTEKRKLALYEWLSYFVFWMGGAFIGLIVILIGILFLVISTIWTLVNWCVDWLGHKD